ncbi:OsmC family protein [Nocardia terpenica]|nr:OsmC family protein [Nocardia terpenica]MBF6105890.1 OsmC family protein [Nocardia terpenica]MBF6113526.1 OsmC family protein [Nocardia terpenica]MBF6119631.1 OsmC family protein [Nocardia terpenica]MBF6152042.1 OsmC family protein [Nocardia terpenica]
MTRSAVDAEALRSTAEAIRTSPVRGRFTFRVDGDWGGGFRLTSRVGALTHGGDTDTARSGRFVMNSDEPTQVLGTDMAVSPTEWVLQALAGCYTVTIAANAALRGISLRAVHLDLEGDVDLSGFLGLDPAARPGIGHIRVAVTLDAPDATAAELENLIEAVQQRSVVRDTLVRPVAVTTTLRRA